MSTSTGGTWVSASSPQLMSKSTPIEKSQNPIEALPEISHGAGPESVPSKLTVKTPTPNAFSAMSQCRPVENRNGENWNSASNPTVPDRLSSLKPKNTSASAPNWTVLLVTAK